MSSTAQVPLAAMGCVIGALTQFTDPSHVAMSSYEIYPCPAYLSFVFRPRPSCKTDQLPQSFCMPRELWLYRPTMQYCTFQ